MNETAPQTDAADTDDEKQTERTNQHKKRDMEIKELLKQAYDDTLAEPIPDDLLELVKKLD